MTSGQEESIEDTIKSLQIELHDWKARCFRSHDNEERIYCRNMIGELSQKIRRLRAELFSNKVPGGRSP